jgi:predicted nucleotidyltransferase
MARSDPSCQAVAVNPTGPGPPRDLSVVVSRFVDACSADERIVAAFLDGSRATDEADEYSDLDLYVITTDEALEKVIAERGSLIRHLGEPVFTEDFGHDGIVFFILADGTECELSFSSEGAIEDIDVGPFKPLIDKRAILADAEFPFAQPDPEEQRERLRRVLNWFWHDLSHFAAALGRGDLWWAYGQLEALRRYCVNLVRIEHGVQAQEEPYEKLAKAVPVSDLAALQSTFCPMERDAMLRAALDVVRYFRERAPGVAAAYGSAYPAELERLMSDRLDRLAASR